MDIRGLNRWQASAGHLGFSVVLGLAVFALFRFLWYPDALFTLAGAGKLLLLVVGIDVVLGPLLTLIVFHPAKKSLIWDLAIIVAVQFGALGYGVLVMAQSRPVFLVGAVDRFELVTANEIHPDSLAQASRPDWSTLSWAGPIVVGAKPPADSEERMTIALDAINGGPDIPQLPRFYVPLEDISDSLVARGHPLSAYEMTAPEAVQSIRAWIRKAGFTESALVVLPLKARDGTGAVLVEKSSGRPLRTLAFDGYERDSSKNRAPTDAQSTEEPSTASHEHQRGLLLGTSYASIPRHDRRAGLGARDPGQPPVPRT